MITSEEQYRAVLDRIEELLKDTQNLENEESQTYHELNLLSDLITDYEERYYPLEELTLIEIIKIKMAEKGLNQKRLSEILGVSTSRVSEYLNGKSEPPLKVAREISRKLDIDAAIVLGV